MPIVQVGNHGKALQDATEATSLLPDYAKALARCATSCYELRRWGEAIEWCDRELGIKGDDRRMEELKKRCEEEINTEGRSEIRRAAERENRHNEEIKITEAIYSHGIRVGGSLASLDTQQLENQGQYRVVLEPNGSLSWPVMLLYPETQQSDLIVAFNENSTLGDQLEVVLSDPPAWDTEGKYKIGLVRVAVFMEGEKKYFNARMDQTLLSILKHPSYVLTSLVPTLHLYCKK